eukprot:6212214-Pleurochrysis_carterae.AAC.2
MVARGGVEAVSQRKGATQTQQDGKRVAKRRQRHSCEHDKIHHAKKNEADDEARRSPRAPHAKNSEAPLACLTASREGCRHTKNTEAQHRAVMCMQGERTSSLALKKKSPLKKQQLLLLTQLLLVLTQLLLLFTQAI